MTNDVASTDVDPDETDPSLDSLSPLPVPQLPRGGLGLSGLGESVEVDPFTGSCTVTVPLAVSAGRGASRADLSLVHSGGGGRSPYGGGWSLGVPRIARSLQDGVPTYTDADTFTLNGHELVPLLVTGTGGALEEYDKPGSIDGTPVRIRRFRTRVDEGQRVERIDAPGDASYWRSWSKDNVVTRYGASDDSRVRDPASGQRVWEWLVDEVRDDRGNVAAYDYKSEDTDQVTPSITEAHRLAPGAPAQPGRYLKRIRYANATPDDAGSTHLMVLLDYGEHDEAAAEARPWPERDDPYSEHRAGFEVRVWRLLRRVMIFHDFPELGPGPSPRLVRTIELGHDETPDWTSLTSITQVGYEWTGVAYASVALPPVELDYGAGEADPVPHTVEMAAVRDGAAPRWVDLDDDGLPGVLWTGSGGWSYQRPAGDGVLLPPRPVEVPLASRDGVPPLLSDVDGSGRLHAVDERAGRCGTTAREQDGSWAPWRAYDERAVGDLDAAERLDIDGDGLADLVGWAPDGVRWRRGRGSRGYDTQGRTAVGGPPVPSADSERQWLRADMTGDGLTDLVRVRSGKVEYWPGLGRGRFGAPITMAAAPWLGDTKSFDPDRVRLVDLDGLGTADLVYLGPDGVMAWTNLSGNGFSAPRRLGPLPTVTPGLDDVQVVDLLGKGSPCLVWSSARPGVPTRFVDLSADHGGRRHVCALRNNLGRRWEVRYSSSSRFATRARLDGRPWATRLAGPVTVATSLTESDDVAGTSHVTTYSYRDGWFDPQDRSFRGFGRVDVGKPGASLTRHWFNIGSGDRPITGAWAGDPAAVHVAPALIEGAQGGREYADAWRALVGRTVRTEVLGDDGASDVPFMVSEERHRVVRTQSSRGDRPAAFRVEPLERLDYAYERVANDPRVTHDLTLHTDKHGNVLANARVAYARRTPAHPEQAHTLLSHATTEVASVDTATVYRIGTVLSQSEYDVAGLTVPAAGRFEVSGLNAALAAAAVRPIEATGLPGATRRLTGETRLEYWNDALTAPLPAGQVGSRALVRRTRRLALTQGLVAAVYGTDVSGAELISAGYEAGGTSWYANSGVTTYDPAVMYQPVVWSFLGNDASVSYDAHSLLVVRTQAAATAPLHLNTVDVGNDYRMLAPDRLTDPHETVSRVRFDPLGRVVAHWLTAADGTGDPGGLPGIVHTYGTDDWRAGVGPAWSQTDTRVTAGDPGASWRRQRLFTDGTGRVAMTKTLAEPGLALVEDGAGGSVLVDTGPALRWVSSGRTVFDQQDRPVEQYEPYYSASPGFEDADAVAKHLLTDRRQYDPLGRVARIDYADGTLERWEIGPWHESHFDRNDAVASSDWLAARQQPGTPAAESRAAALALAHAGTPSVSVADPLGRLVRTRADLGTGPGGLLETVQYLDLEGRVLRVDDALGRVTATSVYDAMGRVIASDSIDAGSQRVLVASDGQPVRQWGAAGDRIRCRYDWLRRRTHLFVTDAGTEVERLADLTVYGEVHPQAVAKFLIGKAARRYDEAGLSRVDAHDLAGNLVAGARIMLATTGPADWSALDGLAWPALNAAAAPSLSGEELLAGSTFDATGHPIVQMMPDGTTLRLSYDAGGLLARVHATPAGAPGFVVLDGVEHDARQRRTRAGYGNGVVTRFRYDDSKSHRMTDVVTTGPSGTLQDLHYTYDPIGNVVQVDDHTASAIFYAGSVTDGTRRFAYDPLYRLVSATGREHASLGVQPDRRDPQLRPVPHPNDTAAVRPYTQTFDYDALGNLTRLAHSAGAGSYTRRYDYDPASNRLRSHSLPGDPAAGPYSAAFDYDAAGRMSAMPHLTELVWDHAGTLREVDLSGGGHLVYHCDARGIRVRTIWQRRSAFREERLYLGDFEIFRRLVNDILVFERTTAHVRDAGRHTAAIERVTFDTAAPGAMPADPVVRYDHGDHLGSSVVETDAAGAVLTYEEYHPYGTTAVWLGAASVSLKRYRYTGKERDEATGLYRMGVRHYAAWLGRWTSPDPAGLVDGANRYTYVNDNPVRLLDPDGLQGGEMEQMWFLESKLLGLERKATAAGRGFTEPVYRYFATQKQLWGGPAKYQLGHPLEKPFALLTEGERTTIVAQSAKSNLKQSALDKRLVAEAVKKGIPKRDPKTGLYPGATKGTRVNQPKIPKVVDARGNVVKLAKPPATPTAPVVPKAPSAPVVPKAPVKVPEQLSLNFDAPKAPASPPLAASAPAVAVKPVAPAPAPPAPPPAAAVKPTGLPKVSPNTGKFVNAADDAAATAKLEAGAAKALQTGGGALKSVVPIVKGGTPVAKNAGVLTKAVSAGGKVLKAATPVVKAAAPVVKAAAPVMRLVGKVAKPLAVGVAAADLATANNNSDRLVAAGDLSAGIAAYCGPVGAVGSGAYTVTGLADEGLAKLSKAMVGQDLSPSSLQSMRMGASDRLISSVIPDSPDKPAYKNENKIAWFLIDTLGF